MTGTWEGISELEVCELEAGVELLRVPLNTSGIYMDTVAHHGLQVAQPQPMIHTKESKYDFKHFQYLVRVS